MDELTDAQIDELQALLEKTEVELRRMLSHSKDDSAPVDLDLPIGRLSRVDAMQQQSMISANRRRAEIRLQQVRAALRKIRDTPEDFGFCNMCDEPIPFRRLSARPETPLCMGCQEGLERR